MNWSCALFGHEKPRFYVQDKNSGLNLYSFVDHPGDLPNGMKLHVCQGVEKRAEPGDVIDMKPDKCWTCDEKQHEEIVGMILNPQYLESRKAEIKNRFLARNGGREGDWRPAARFERIWRERFLKFGLNDPRLLPLEVREYFSFLPGASLWKVRGEDVWGTTERKHFLVIDIEDLDVNQLDGIREVYWDTNSYREYSPMPKSEFSAMMKGSEVEKEYSEYLANLAAECSMPTEIVKKRRFKIQTDDLRSAGVDIDKMLDPNIEYVPGVSIPKNVSFDKLKSRKLSAVDNLKGIQPRKVV